MLYGSSECGSISIMQLYAQFIATQMYVHFMRAYVYLHYTFVCNSTYLLKLDVPRYDSTQHDALKALSHGAIFLATCNAILLPCKLEPNV